MKKIFIAIIIFISIVLFFFWIAINYLYVDIDNRIENQICLHSVKLGFIEHINNKSLGYRESVMFSDFWGLSNKVTVYFSSAPCDKTDKIPVETVSCTLNRVGSDSCHIYLHDSAIDCTECYK